MTLRLRRPPQPADPKDITVPKQSHFRSNDMGLVTYLKMNSQSVQGMEWFGGTCYWVFWATENLMALVATFEEDEALVPPREYNRVYTQTKREFYDSKKEHGR